MNYSILKINKYFLYNLSSKTTIGNSELHSKLKHFNIKFYLNKDNLKNKRTALNTFLQTLWLKILTDQKWLNSKVIILI